MSCAVIILQLLPEILNAQGLHYNFNRLIQSPWFGNYSQSLRTNFDLSETEQRAGQELR